MIFPPIRISQLSRDVEQKRAGFRRSSDVLKVSVRRKLSPLNLLRENPQWLITPVMSLFSAGTIGKVIFSFFGHKNDHSKNGNGSKRDKSGMLGSLFRFGGRTLFKTAAPVAFTAIKFAFRSAFRSFRQRRA